MPVEVGVREFRARLSHWLARAAAGEEIVVTERGRPKARVMPPDWTSTRDRLIAEGLLIPAKLPKGTTPLPKPIKVKGGIDDILRDAKGRF